LASTSVGHNPTASMVSTWIDGPTDLRTSSTSSDISRFTTIGFGDNV
jgi:hypothetical protein